MEIVFILVVILVSILLVLAVLIQRSKGGGLASNLGISNQLLGAQRETDAIERVTWILVGSLMVLSLSSGFILSRNQTTATTLSEEQLVVPTIENSMQNPNPGAGAAPMPGTQPTPAE